MTWAQYTNATIREEVTATKVPLSLHHLPLDLSHFLTPSTSRSHTLYIFLFWHNCYRLWFILHFYEIYILPRFSHTSLINFSRLSQCSGLWTFELPVIIQILCRREFYQRCWITQCLTCNLIDLSPQPLFSHHKARRWGTIPCLSVSSAASHSIEDACSQARRTPYLRHSKWLNEVACKRDVHGTHLALFNIQMRGKSALQWTWFGESKKKSSL